jgi:CRISPR-associated exonuclease Cas4
MTLANTQITITGTEIAYLYICRRKLWLFHHGIRPENENVAVQIGRQIGERSFKRANKELKLGDIGVVDWAELQHGVIHETKKAKCPMDADVAQVRYYLWWMRGQGMNVDRCVIHYPKQKRTREIAWEDEMAAHVEDDLANARAILSAPDPPPYQPLKWCKSCAYAEFCMA